MARLKGIGEGMLGGAKLAGKHPTSQQCLGTARWDACDSARWTRLEIGAFWA